jgi:hypothetical protein
MIFNEHYQQSVALVDFLRLAPQKIPDYRAAGSARKPVFPDNSNIPRDILTI